MNAAESFSFPLIWWYINLTDRVMSGKDVCRRVREKAHEVSGAVSQRINPLIQEQLEFDVG